MINQKVIGIVGGGQLGRMLTLAALPLGFKVVVVDASDNCPAAQVGAEQIKGTLQDKQALRELAEKSDYITVEIEHLDTAILEEIAKAGTPVNPAPSTIELIQDKYLQKKFLQQNGLPVAKFNKVDGFEQSRTLLKQFGGSMMLKTRRNAYDGRGNAVIRNEKELQTAFERFGDAELYAEKLVSFNKELAVIVAKDVNENVFVYPVVETVHKRSICTEVLMPAAVSRPVRTNAEAIASETVAHLKGAGVYAVELFLLQDDTIIINEIAPRVHNSGHITMNACRTSQFEQHIRAITGLPFGDTQMTGPAAVMVNVLGEQNSPTKLKGMDKALADPNVYVHIYGKSPTKIDRKMGHINALGDTITEARSAGRAARQHITI